MNAIDLSTTPTAATAQTTSKTAAKTKKTRQRRPWTPSPLDLQTFERVRMQGEKQLDVALGLGISQSTVSRMVRRVERWQSRATPREAGRLEHGEAAGAALADLRAERAAAGQLPPHRGPDGVADPSHPQAHHAAKPRRRREDHRREHGARDLRRRRAVPAAGVPGSTWSS